MSEKLLLGTGSGGIYILEYPKKYFSLIYETEEDNEYIKGFTKSDSTIFISSSFSLFSIDEEDISICNKYSFNDPMTAMNLFGYIRCIGDYLFIPLSSSNNMIVIKLNDKFISTKVHSLIKFPITKKVTNFDNIDSIDYMNGRYFVCFSKLGDCENDGGLIELDDRLEPLAVNKYGWNTHSLSCVDNRDVYVVCSGKSDKFPSGMVRNNRVIIQCNFAPTDFSMNKDHIFIVGNTYLDKETGTGCSGIVTVYNRDFKHEATILITGVGSLLGCILLGEDLTRQSYKNKINFDDVDYDMSIGVEKVKIIKL